MPASVGHIAVARKATLKSCGIFSCRLCQCVFLSNSIDGPNVNFICRLANRMEKDETEFPF